jgi:bifunctional DNase/RNase
VRKKRKVSYNKRQNVLIIIFFLSLFFIYSFSRQTNFQLQTPIQIPSIQELSTEGYKKFKIEADVFGNTGIVKLTTDCYELIAYTEAHQAESIKNGLEGKIGFRPNTHDLTVSIFKNLGIKILMVKITDLRNNTFISDLILQQGKNILTLDSRPSDAIALAVRMGVKDIYIKEDLLKSYGRKIC